MASANDLIGSILRSGLNWFSRTRLPKIAGNIKLSGLNSKVEVLRDKWGVPHIYASTSYDLFFAQGFVEAQDRLFQMELNRRTARGYEKCLRHGGAKGERCFWHGAQPLDAAQ